MDVLEIACAAADGWAIRAVFLNAASERIGFAVAGNRAARTYEPFLRNSPLHYPKAPPATQWVRVWHFDVQEHGELLSVWEYSGYSQQTIRFDQHSMSLEPDHHRPHCRTCHCS